MVVVPYALYIFTFIIIIIIIIITGGCADHDAISSVQTQQCTGGTTAAGPHVGRNPAEHRTEATA